MVSSRKKKYGRALSSIRWRALRKKVLDRDNHVCRICLEGGRPWNELEIHHLSYEHLGQERPEDLATLCSACHGRTHDIQDLGTRSALVNEVKESDEVARWFRVLEGRNDDG